MPQGIYKHKKGYKRPLRDKNWSEKISQKLKGRPTWNKGLKLGKSKMSLGALKLRGEKAGKTKKGIPIFKLRGENSHFWKGGITPINRKIRTSLEYKIWRRAVFERDNFTCIWCKVKSGNGKAIILNADHIKSFAFYPELRFAIDNGRTLCVPCHKTTDTFAGRGRKDIAVIKSLLKK